MNWCEWCRSYHGPKADHIGKTLWLLPKNVSSADDKQQYLLFGTKKAAEDMGFATAHKPFKVTVQLEKD